MTNIDMETLRSIIMNKNIKVHYQPLVSIIRKSIIGLEGLSRGIVNGELIPPLDLFECAGENRERVSLDRLCGEKVIEEFRKYYQKNKELLLFINIDGSAITEDIIEKDFIINLINQHNLKAENIVLEIIESKVVNNDLLKKFIQNYRAYGFLIALDDVGSGNSNLDRISIAKPDIIKIDRAIVCDMHRDYYKQEVFKSLVSLSKNLGALVVAEGIECEEEAIKAIELGADLLQGFYFSKPEDIDPLQLKNYNVPVRKLANHYSKYLSEKISAQKKKHREYAEITKEVLEEISQYEERRFDFQLLEIINKYQVFECLYILDPSGIQVTDTITQFASFSKHKGLIFQPAKKGEDHSLKKYYFFLRNMKLSKYITEPYISLASGNLCITMSCVFKNMEGHKYILCIDLNPDYLYM